MPYQPRDFIETPEGLIFAVVDGQPEEGRVLCSLRYTRDSGYWKKLDTSAANAWLDIHAPAYRFWSSRLAVPLHGVPVDSIIRHHQPRQRVSSLLNSPHLEGLEAKAIGWVRILSRLGLDPTQIGLTGSLLIGAQHEASDLDFVIYGRTAFRTARKLVQQAIDTGHFNDLDDAAWHDAYQRRGCALDYESYLWHERRKGNKGLYEGTKFDITLIEEPGSMYTEPVHKLGPVRLKARVLDADGAYDHPATYILDHGEIGRVLAFTQTYAGQAYAGEVIEIAGVLEETASKQRQIVVGSSREAPEEYIRVLHHGHTGATARDKNLTNLLDGLEAVILDMDGLAIDSETTYCHAWRKAASETGHDLSQEFCESLFGRHADDVVQALAERLGPDFDRSGFFRRAEAHWFDHVRQNGIQKMPGLDQWLDLLHGNGIPFALATNSDGPYARICLDRAGLTDVFPVVVTRDQVEHGKPAPDLFLEAARQLGANPGKCLVLEDSEPGLEAAIAAGIPAVLVQSDSRKLENLAPAARLASSSLFELGSRLRPFLRPPGNA